MTHIDSSGIIQMSCSWLSSRRRCFAVALLGARVFLWITLSPVEHFEPTFRGFKYLKNGFLSGPGKDFKSPCLQSALQGKLSKQPSEESDGQPPAKRKKIDLIFKHVLEASLEDSGKFRFRSGQTSEYKVPALVSGFDSSESGFGVPNLKVEEKEEENQSTEKPSTSFCPNCVKLKRRILELEEELSRLRGEQGDAAAPATSEQTQRDQAPPHPEQGPIEDFQGM